MSKRLNKAYILLKKYFLHYWRTSLWQKFVVIFLLFIFVIGIFMYSIGEYYIVQQSNQPITLGVSFIPDYASYLGLNSQQTMKALLKIGVRDFRLTSYWTDIEPTKGHYNFSQLDWEFKLAEEYHAKITLVLGLRQPNWPECHIPNWATNEPTKTWQPQLYTVMKKVINQFKNSPSLQYYQLENEYFLKGFGNCTNFSRKRLIHEFNLIKQLDPYHQIIIGRSNNAIGLPIGQPQPNIFSISIYRRVWDANVTHLYLEYPYPSWYFAFLAEMQQIFEGKNMYIEELQAEPWTPNGLTITQTPLKVLNHALNAHQFQQNITFAKNTGMKTIMLWGAEYWYYLKVKYHDSSFWNIAKQEFKKTK